MSNSIRTLHVPENVLQHLRASDSVMSGLVERLGPFEYTVDADLWRAVTGSIDTIESSRRSNRPTERSRLRMPTVYISCASMSAATAASSAV